MIEHSTSITELSKALHGAQGQMTGVFKDAKNFDREDLFREIAMRTRARMEPLFDRQIADIEISDVSVSARILQHVL